MHVVRQRRSASPGVLLEQPKATKQLTGGAPHTAAGNGCFNAQQRGYRNFECRVPSGQPRATRILGARSVKARYTARPVAFVKTEDTVRVNLDAYKLLGVSLIASEDSILKAYDKLIAACPEAELSQGLLCSRAVVLKATADTLLDRPQRFAYDQDGLLEIPQEDIPGAVALLAEAGDWSTAIEWGRAWLARNGGHAAAADVALCVAVALCDQAESESSGRGDLEAAAAALQSAATLLRKYNCGSKLQADISSHLQELTLRVICRMASLCASRACLIALRAFKTGQIICRDLTPKMLLQVAAASSSIAGSRSDLVAGLKGILWKEGQPVENFKALNIGRKMYLETLCAQLSAAEQTQLFDGMLPASDDEVYIAALANLASGLRTATPANIKTAIKLLHGIGNKTEPATGRRRFDALDVTVETAACHLLLGDVAAAEDVLGFGITPSHAADPAVRQFVQSQSEDPSDVLPGLYQLAQQWVAEVLVTRYPELAESRIDFDSWFSSPRVSLYLQVEDKRRQLGMGGLAHVLAGLAAAVSTAWRLLLGAFGKSQRTSSEQSPPPAVSQSSTASGPSPEHLDSPKSLLKTKEAADVAVQPMLPTRHAADGQLAQRLVGSAVPTGPSEVPDRETSSFTGDDSPLPAAKRLIKEAVPSKPEIRQAIELPLDKVADQTVGELQQQLQQVAPLDDGEDGFSTEYFDAPIPQPPLAADRRPPGLLAMQGEREMWVSYRSEKRRMRNTALLLTALLVGILTYCVLAPAQAALGTSAWTAKIARFFRPILPRGAVQAM